MRCGFEKESDLSYADDGALIRKIWFGGNQPFSNAENSALDRQDSALVGQGTALSFGRELRSG